MKLTAAAFLVVLVTLTLASPFSSAQVGRRKSFVDEQNRVKITNGPILESLKSDSATIAWSTNAKSDSKVAYGPRRNHLLKFESAEADGKGLMHRIPLKGLEPGKTYFFQVHSRNATTNSKDSSRILSFTTPALGAEARRNEVPQ